MLPFNSLMIPSDGKFEVEGASEEGVEDSGMENVSSCKDEQSELVRSQLSHT